MKLTPILTAAGAITVGAMFFVGCNSDSTATKQKAAAAANNAAQQVYVAPGKLDEYYAILSGGQSGSMFVCMESPRADSLKRFLFLNRAPGRVTPIIPVRKATNGSPRQARCGATHIIQC
jgi:nitrous oxide reductase